MRDIKKLYQLYRRRNLKELLSNVASISFETSPKRSPETRGSALGKSSEFTLNDDSKMATADFTPIRVASETAVRRNNVTFF